jgi:hypothetical protein
MRPTIQEQLRETQRILTDVISPCIRDEHPAQLLAYLVSNLRMLEDSWNRILPFLHWDNAQTAGLLQALCGKVDPALAAAIRAALEINSPDSLDIEAVERRNVLLRDLLTRCVTTCDVADLAPVRAHLLERATRFPMRPAPRFPASNEGTQAR